MNGDDNTLSQEEIEALLSGMGGESKDNGVSAAPESGGKALADADRKVLEEIFRSTSGNSGMILSTIINKEVDITFKSISLMDGEQLKEKAEYPMILLEIKLIAGFDDIYYMVMGEKEIISIGESMTGNTPQNTTYDVFLNSLVDGFMQMVSSSSTGLSMMIGMNVDVSAPVISKIDSSAGFSRKFTLSDPVVAVTYKIKIDSDIDSEFIEVYPHKLCMDIVSAYRNKNARHTKKTVSHEEKVGVQPVKFAPLQEAVVQELPKNIELLMDVPMNITVELGRTKLSIKEILELDAGSIVELDKVAGAPVDLLVNGKLIAKGEVVVIDENFGLRVTDILSPEERIKKLK